MAWGAAAGAEAQEGQFGLIPLLAGTVYIAFVAMLFAVPVGLMAAIYMAEYASKRVRSVVKPLLEVLAGIPTIVYGFFALVTVGPFLRDMSAAIAGGPGFIQAQSVLTAGLSSSRTSCVDGERRVYKRRIDVRGRERERLAHT